MKRKNSLLFGTLGVSVLLGTILKKAIYDTTNIKATELDINIQGVKKPQRIMFLADLQIGNLIQKPKEIKKLVNNSDIDILILGGDMIDDEEDLAKIREFLSGFNVEYKYYVMGNHEYVLNKEQMRDFKELLKDLGFKDINNKNISLDGFNVVGIDDILRRKDNIVMAYEGINKENNFNLVVCHNHDVNYKLDELGYNADLIISGHTHGGQIVLPFNIVYKTTKLSKERNLYKGEYYFKGTNKTYRNYTVNGLGGSRTPLRINAQQEMLILNIKKH